MVALETGVPDGNSVTVGDGVAMASVLAATVGDGVRAIGDGVVAGGALAVLPEQAATAKTTESRVSLFILPISPRRINAVRLAPG
jgi:hypothetical protein